MNEQYFYQDLGKTAGPLSAEEVKGRIRDGRIRVFDLLFRDGESAWKIALEHASLRSEFKSNTLNGLKDRPWVVLKRRDPKAADFVTTGPFNQEELRDQLNAGEISYNDYAWKDGFVEWRRIGALEEFNLRARNVPLPHAPAPTSIEELLKDVVELRRPRLSEDLPPEEADGQDLAAAKDFAYDFVDEDVADEDVASEPPPELKAPTPKVPFADEETIINFERSRAMNHAGFTAPESEPQLPTAQTHVQPEPERRTRSQQDPTAIVAPQETTAHKVPTGRLNSGARKRSFFDWSLVAILIVVLVGSVVVISRFANLHSPAALSDLIQKMTEVAPPIQSAPLPGANEIHEPVASSVLGAASAPAPVSVSAPATRPAVPVEGAKSLVTPAIVQPEAASDNLADNQENESDEPESKPPEAMPSVPARAAKVLFLSVKPQGSKPPRIEVRTDAAGDVPVYLQVIGAPGQVVEGGAFYRYLKLPPTGNVKKPLDVSALKLPAGKFIFRAQTGDLKKESKLTFGLDAQAKGTLSRQRKFYSSSLWKERLALFHLCQVLEKQLTAALVPGSSLSTKGLEAIGGVKKSNGGTFLMFEDWWELREILTDAKTAVTPALIARVQHERDYLSTFTVWK